ncbi:MAG: 5'-nucleotidase C-terminal domain-containing protein [Oscillospiraceae bacterium]|nr:5'-nucleotidase C-terminal domain-containing protein [Oscillospiraceae bacterium]
MEETKIEAITAVVVGYTPVWLEGEREFVRKAETNLANAITDSLIHATNAQIAIYNGGGIRESIEPGEITMGQVLTVLPFSNLVVTVQLSGADILKALEHGVSEYPELAGSYVQVAGLEFEFDPVAESGKRIATVKLSDGSFLEPEQIYTVSTIEYLALGGDGYDMLANGQNLVYYDGDADAFVNYLKTKPNIKSEAEGRVSAVNSVFEIAETGDSAFPKTGNSVHIIMWIFVSSVVVLGVATFSAERKCK